MRRMTAAVLAAAALALPAATAQDMPYPAGGEWAYSGPVGMMTANGHAGDDPRPGTPHAEIYGPDGLVARERVDAGEFEILSIAQAFSGYGAYGAAMGSGSEEGKTGFYIMEPTSEEEARASDAVTEPMNGGNIPTGSAFLTGDQPALFAASYKPGTPSLDDPDLDPGIIGDVETASNMLAKGGGTLGLESYQGFWRLASLCWEYEFVECRQWDWTDLFLRQHVLIIAVLVIIALIAGWMAYKKRRGGTDN